MIRGEIQIGGVLHLNLLAKLDPCKLFSTIVQCVLTLWCDADLHPSNLICKKDLHAEAASMSKFPCWIINLLYTQGRTLASKTWPHCVKFIQIQVIYCSSHLDTKYRQGCSISSTLKREWKYSSLALASRYVQCTILHNGVRWVNYGLSSWSTGGETVSSVCAMLPHFATYLAVKCQTRSTGNPPAQNTKGTTKEKPHPATSMYRIKWTEIH